MPRFKDIPRFETPNYQVDVGWNYLGEQLEQWKDGYGLELEPDFQRGHVWTQEQQIDFLEFRMMGGISGGDIFWNCPNWALDPGTSPLQLVDGLQRITAVRGFIDSEIPIFGHYFNEFTDNFDWMRHRFRFHVNSLKTKTEVLRWYLALNNGGTIHTPEEIKRVTELLENCENKKG